MSLASDEDYEAGKLVARMYTGLADMREQFRKLVFDKGIRSVDQLGPFWRGWIEVMSARKPNSRDTRLFKAIQKRGFAIRLKPELIKCKRSGCVNGQVNYSSNPAQPSWYKCHFCKGTGVQEQWELL